MSPMEARMLASAEGVHPAITTIDFTFRISVLISLAIARVAIKQVPAERLWHPRPTNRS
jgi:hypothetical protein